MRIDPNKPKPTPKPIPSATEQVMQVVKWGIAIVVLVSIVQAFSNAANDKGGNFGEFAEQSKKDLAQIKSAAKEAEAPSNQAIAEKSGNPYQVPNERPNTETVIRDPFIPVPSQQTEPVISESNTSGINCRQAERIVNNPPEMVKACAMEGITLRGEAPANDNIQPLPELFDAYAKNGEGLTIWTDNRNSRAFRACQELDIYDSRNPKGVVEYCKQFADGNEFGEN